MAAAATANHSHRAGKLKQQNKKNKRSAASKRSRNRSQGGKVQSLPSGHRKGVKSHDAGGRAKANRTNAARQRREASRKDAWNARRGIGTVGGGALPADAAASLSRALSAAPPRIVGIVSLSEAEGRLEERVRRSLMGGADKVVAHLPGSASASYGAHSKGGHHPHLTLLANASSFRPQYSSEYGEEDASVQAALDLCRVCDVVLFLIDGSTAVVASSNASIVHRGGAGSDAQSLAATSIKTSNTTAHLDHLISERGDRILSAVKAQGLPTPVTVIVHKEANDAGGSGGIAIDGRVPKGVGPADDEDVMEEDDEDMEEEDTFASLPNASLSTHRSVKSIRRSYLRKRTELKRYVSRLATTEFGVEAGSKVLELDLLGGEDEEDGFANTTMEAGRVPVAASVVNTGKAIDSTSATAAAASKSQASVSALIRTLCAVSASPPSWVADVPRPYLVTDGCAAADPASGATPAIQYDVSKGELSLTGYIRGTAPLNANQLVHVPHLGTYAVKNVTLAGVRAGNELLPPILAAGRIHRKNKAAEKNVEMQDADSPKSDAKHDDGRVLLAESNPEERESLEMFASPDVLEGEQNLIGFDEDYDGDHFDDDLEDKDQGGDKKKSDHPFQPGTSRPAGWSDYQSAWLDALDDNEGDDAEDHGELAFALNKKPSPSDKDALADGDDVEVNAEEKRALLEARKKGLKDNLQFTDEVDHEEETSARDRYARYRALKSFRKSYWDPKENLPETYGAVYHFSSFRATQRDVLGDARAVEDVVRRRGWGVNVAKSCGEDGDAEMEQDSEDDDEEATARACVPPRAYVTVNLEGVPPSAYAAISPHAVLAAVSLLPHENKVSVLHMGLSSSSTSRSSSNRSEYDMEIPVKSKDALTFRCGWRTWTSRPIFSQNNLNSDKHKFERYMPRGSAFFAGSLYGPVTYANCPVLMFREAKGAEAASISDVGGEGGSAQREFLAHGSILGADADRIVLKRIVLTGYPTRVHKRHATVKYMFYNPEDVKWFMPAGITTKHGLQGNIVQSVGDHGVMKCLFNAPIKQHDTVCLPLYKRVFPKFAPVGKRGEEGSGDEKGEGSAGVGGKHFQVL